MVEEGAHPAFLQNRLLAQVKSSRSINRFRILHGRLFDFINEIVSRTFPLEVPVDQSSLQRHSWIALSCSGSAIDLSRCNSATLASASQRAYTAVFNSRKAARNWSRSPLISISSTAPSHRTDNEQSCARWSLRYPR